MFHINYFNGYIIFPHWMRHHLRFFFFFKERWCVFASHSTPFVALQGLQIMTNWEILSRIDVLTSFYSKSEFEPPTSCVDSWHQLFRFPSRSGINTQNQFLGSTKSHLPPPLGSEHPHLLSPPLMKSKL